MLGVACYLKLCFRARRIDPSTAVYFVAVITARHGLLTAYLHLRTTLGVVELPLLEEIRDSCILAVSSKQAPRLPFFDAPPSH